MANEDYGCLPMMIEGIHSISYLSSELLASSWESDLSTWHGKAKPVSCSLGFATDVCEVRRLSLAPCFSYFIRLPSIEMLAKVNYAPTLEVVTQLSIDHINRIFRFSNR